MSRSPPNDSTPTMTDRNIRSHTTAVLSYQPRHMTYVLWPETLVAKKSKDLRKEDLVQIPPHNSKLRHDPTVPIIEGYKVSVHDHSIDVGLFEKTFSYTSASIEPVKLGKQKAMEGFEALKSDMSEAQQLNGTSTINLFTYKPRDGRNNRDAESQIHVRVWRESEFRFDGGLVVKREAWYDFPVTALGGPRGRSTTREAKWLTNVKDSLWRRTDTAVLQALEFMEVMHVEEDQVEWKHPRYPDYATALEPNVVSPASLPAGRETICRICWCELAQPGQECVALPCKRHHFHRECISRVMEASGISKSSSPLCKALIFPAGTKGLEFLKYGTQGKDYITDPRYNQFENFERSCADIDQSPASECHERVRVSKALITAILELLIDGAKLEPESFANTPEMDFLKQAVKSAGKEMDGKTTKVRHVYLAIFSHLRMHMATAFKAGGMLPTLTNSEIKRLKTDSFVAETSIRPDFDEVTSRMTSRLSQFLRLRRCRHRNGLHAHGKFRFYYNPDDELWAPPRTTNH